MDKRVFVGYLAGYLVSVGIAIVIQRTRIGRMSCQQLVDTMCNEMERREKTRRLKATAEQRRKASLS